MDFVDEITLTGLRVFGHHGVYDTSAGTARSSSSTSTLCVDTARAAATDDVADTVHYGELAERVAASSAASRST